MMRSASLAIAVLLAVAAPPAGAEGADASKPADSAPSAAPGAAPPGAAAAPSSASRFSFQRIDDGFLRLDNMTGQISLCSPHSVGWACQAVPEDRAALEQEIARLQRQVESLRREVAGLRAGPPPPRPPAALTPPSTQAPKPDQGEDTARLRGDLDRARLALQNAWKRLVEIIVNLQKDMMRKG